MKKFGDDWTLMVAALLLEGTQRRGQNGVSNTTIVVGQSLALTGPDRTRILAGATLSTGGANRAKN
jgi:hypothetical protein